MTERNFEKELCYNYYRDMEDGNDTETICYPSLFCVLKELCDRIEKLEQRLEEIQPSMNDVSGPTKLIGDPQ